MKDSLLLSFPVLELSNVFNESFPYSLLGESLLDELHLYLPFPLPDSDECPHPHADHETLIIANIREKCFNILTLLLREIPDDLRTRWSIPCHVVRDSEGEIHRNTF